MIAALLERVTQGALLAQRILDARMPPIGRLLHAPANWNGPDECRWEG